MIFGFTVCCYGHVAQARQEQRNFGQPRFSLPCSDGGHVIDTYALWLETECLKTKKICNMVVGDEEPQGRRETRYEVIPRGPR